MGQKAHRSYEPHQYFSFADFKTLASPHLHSLHHAEPATMKRRTKPTAQQLHAYRIRHGMESDVEVAPAIRP
jgi:hypothetical protein